MITIRKTEICLSRAQLLWRGGLIAATAVCAGLLRALDPATAHGWVPLSCGAVTGVPCIFCGTTRALHSLLNGDFSRALYLNWIAFPVAALALFGIAIGLCELITGKRLVRFRSFRVTPRVISLSLVVLFVTWTFQVWLAVSQHKTELLNPRGPLYAVFVGH